MNIKNKKGDIIFSNTDDDLIYAKLSGADLSDADLSGANLRGADFSYSNLSGANLRGADFSYSNLMDANLRGADLSETDLRGVDLRYAIGNSIQIHSMQLQKWNIVFTSHDLAIGCQQHTIARWKEFSDDEISAMDADALVWWKKWRDFIFLAIELCDVK